MNACSNSYNGYIKVCDCFIKTFLLQNWSGLWGVNNWKNLIFSSVVRSSQTNHTSNFPCKRMQLKYQIPRLVEKIATMASWLIQWLTKFCNCHHEPSEHVSTLIAIHQESGSLTGCHASSPVTYNQNRAKSKACGCTAAQSFIYCLEDTWKPEWA